MLEIDTKKGHDLLKANEMNRTRFLDNLTESDP